MTRDFMPTRPGDKSSRASLALSKGTLSSIKPRPTMKYAFRRTNYGRLDAEDGSVFYQRAPGSAFTGFHPSNFSIHRRSRRSTNNRVIVPFNDLLSSRGVTRATTYTSLSFFPGATLHRHRDTARHSSLSVSPHDSSSALDSFCDYQLSPGNSYRG